MKYRNLFKSGLGLLAGLLVAAQVVAAPLKIGVTPGAFADSVHVAAAEAKKQGLDVEVVEFSDWTTPNVALQNKDLDANYFQHLAFLENAIKERGYKFEVAGLGILPNIGLYSARHKSFADIPVGGQVAIANDPVNQGRGLALLQTAGLIKLRDGVGAQGSVLDVVENPKKLKFVEVAGPQLARVVNDVDLAQGYPHFIVASGAFDAGSGLIYSGVDETRFALRFVARDDNAKDPRLLQFVKLYHESEAVRERIRKSYGDNERLYSLAWLKH